MPLSDDLAFLPALDALLEQASVTRAADRCGLSQPAMSRALARLRHRFADPLLVREGGRWRLTPRAEQLRDPVRALLAQVALLDAAADFAPASAERVFRVAIPDVVAAVLLPALQAVLRERAPRCRLALAPWPGRAARHDSIDLAIGTEPAMFPHFRMNRLFEDIDVVAGRAADGTPPRDALFTRPHVAVVPTGLTTDLADDWLAGQGITRPVALVVPHYLQALHIVARSDLLAVLPRRLVAALGGVLGVAAIDAGVPQQPDLYWLFHPPHLDADPASIWLRDVIRGIADARGR